VVGVESLQAVNDRRVRRLAAPGPAGAPLPREARILELYRRNTVLTAAVPRRNAEESMRRFSTERYHSSRR
jgi:hypothetical protein